MWSLHARVGAALMAGWMVSCAQVASEATSAYTDLAGPGCKLEKEDKETGASVTRCSGVAGFSVLVHSDDDRMSVTVISPDGKQHPLDYWNVVTRGFSHIGPKAEWRVVKRGDKLAPVALIVRVEAREGEPAKKRSYLAVAKITPEKTCVTRRIGPVPSANEAARKAADESGAEACLTSANLPPNP